MKMHVISSLASTKATTIEVDGAATTIYQGDIVEITHNNAKIIKYEVVDFTKYQLIVKLIILSGLPVSHEGLIKIGILESTKVSD